LQLFRRDSIPPVNGCDLEFNGFITAKDNKFIQLIHAEQYAATLNNGSTPVTKTYMCSTDITQQYQYWEVGEITGFKYRIRKLEIPATTNTLNSQFYQILEGSVIEFFPGSNNIHMWEIVSQSDNSDYPTAINAWYDRINFYDTNPSYYSYGNTSSTILFGQPIMNLFTTSYQNIAWYGHYAASGDGQDAMILLYREDF
jgi:hypothetical protein